MTKHITADDRCKIREIAEQQYGKDLYYIEYHGPQTFWSMATAHHKDRQQLTTYAKINGEWRIWAQF